MQIRYQFFFFSGQIASFSDLKLVADTCSEDITVFDVFSCNAQFSTLRRGEKLRSDESRSVSAMANFRRQFQMPLHPFQSESVLKR